MRDNTGNSYSYQDKSWGDRELFLEQQNESDFTSVNELSDSENSLSPFWLGLCWGGIVALTAVVSAVAGASLTQFNLVSDTVTDILVAYNSHKSFLPSSSTESTDTLSITRPVNLLLVGSNQQDNSQSTAILLLRFEPEDNSVQITSIPQEYQVKMPGRGLGTIQEAHNRGGIKMVSQVVNKTLDNVEIDRYIQATPTTLSKLINLLGGVEVFIPQESLQQPATPKIKYISGWQTLDGEQIVKYVLQDRQNDKFEQIQQKQMLIEAVRQRLHHPSFTDNLTETVQTLHNYLDTDLTLLEMESLLLFLHQLERNEVTVELIPNSEEKRQSPADNFIVSNKKDNRASSSKNSAYSGYAWRNMPIAIQNTTDNPELSIRVLEYLIGQGFYNVYLNKHIPLELSETEIVTPSDNLVAANYLQKVLRVGKLEISPVNNTGPELTVRIGEDAKFMFLDNSLIK